jgi:hypothetical protein
MNQNWNQKLKSVMNLKIEILWEKEIDYIDES